MFSLAYQFCSHLLFFYLVNELNRSLERVQKGQ